MPYIGNTAADRFVASKAATQFSGDGSTTAFTLEHSVGADEDILVSVDGVVQEPSVAYAVSNGTTLTFTAAPSSNSGNNIFVYYLFRTIGTVSHPSNNALSASTGTFSGALSAKGGAVFNEDSADVNFRVESNGNANMLFVDGGENRVGIGSNAPTTLLHLQGSEPDIFLRRTDLTNKAWRFNVQSSTGDLNIKSRNDDGSASTTSMVIAHDGYVTKPNQPSFLAHPASTITNISAGQNALTFGTERFDRGADYNTSNGTFTAPVTGLYQLNVHFYMLAVDTAATYYEGLLITSNKTYGVIVDPNFSADMNYYHMELVVLADMDAADTATIRMDQLGGTAQTDMSANCLFSGYLVA